jgi:hypothetical protein
MAAAMKRNKVEEVYDDNTPKVDKKLEGEVADKLLELVGKPGDFVSVKAHQIYSSWFRVNMRTVKPSNNSMITLTKIEHSYFVRYVDGNFVDGDTVEKLY